MASQDPATLRPAAALICLELKNKIKTDPDWLVRSIAKARLFAENDEHMVDSIVAALQGSEHEFTKNPTIVEVQKALHLLDKDFLYKISGQEDSKGRSLELYRADAVLFCEVFKKKKRNLKNSIKRSLSKSTVQATDVAKDEVMSTGDRPPRVIPDMTPERPDRPSPWRLKKKTSLIAIAQRDELKRAATSTAAISTAPTSTAAISTATTSPPLTAASLIRSDKSSAKELRDRALRMGGLVREWAVSPECAARVRQDLAGSCSNYSYYTSSYSYYTSTAETVVLNQVETVATPVVEYEEDTTVPGDPPDQGSFEPMDDNKGVTKLLM